MRVSQINSGVILACYTGSSPETGGALCATDHPGRLPGNAEADEDMDKLLCEWSACLFCLFLPEFKAALKGGGPIFGMK